MCKVDLKRDAKYAPSQILQTFQNKPRVADFSEKQLYRIDHMGKEDGVFPSWGAIYKNR